MPASIAPPERDDDAPSAEELIVALSECALSSETVLVPRPDVIDEIIMMCRHYVVSLEGRLFVNQLYNRRRH